MSAQYRCPRCRRPVVLRTFPVLEADARLTRAAEPPRACPACGWQGPPRQFRAADLTPQREVGA